MKTGIKFLAVIGSLAGLLACGELLENGEDYGDLLDSPGGITLIEAEHEIGWGRSDCTACHNLENIHLVNNSSLPIDIDAVHERAIEDGEAGCTVCHGDNGT